MLNFHLQNLDRWIEQCKAAVPWLDRGRKPRPPEASLQPRFDGEGLLSLEHNNSLKQHRDRFGPLSKLKFVIVIWDIAPAAGALQSCLLLPSPHPIAPLPRHPRSTGTVRRRRLAGEPRAAEGGAVQARCGHRSCSVGGCAHLQLGSTSATH